MLCAQLLPVRHQPLRFGLAFDPLPDMLFQFLQFFVVGKLRRRTVQEFERAVVVDGVQAHVNLLD